MIVRNVEKDASTSTAATGMGSPSLRTSAQRLPSMTDDCEDVGNEASTSIAATCMGSLSYISLWYKSPSVRLKIFSTTSVCPFLSERGRSSSQANHITSNRPRVRKWRCYTTRPQRIILGNLDQFLSWPAVVQVCVSLHVICTCDHLRVSVLTLFIPAFVFVGTTCPTITYAKVIKVCSVWLEIPTTS